MKKLARLAHLRGVLRQSAEAELRRTQLQVRLAEAAARAAADRLSLQGPQSAQLLQGIAHDAATFVRLGDGLREREAAALHDLQRCAREHRQVEILQERDAQLQAERRARVAQSEIEAWLRARREDDT